MYSHVAQLRNSQYIGSCTDYAKIIRTSRIANGWPIVVSNPFLNVVTLQSLFVSHVVSKNRGLDGVHFSLMWLGFHTKNVKQIKLEQYCVGVEIGKKTNPN